MSTCKGDAALVCSDYSHLPHRLRFHAQLVIAALRRAVHSVKIESENYSHLNSESLFRIFLQKRLLGAALRCYTILRKKRGEWNPWCIPFWRWMIKLRSFIPKNKATVPYNFMLKSLMHEAAFILRTFCSQLAYGPTSPVFRKKSFGHTRMWSRNITVKQVVTDKILFGEARYFC